ncbi:DUF6223 family protein [Streptomyces sp. SCSIO 30461]|uniref:DUF6223 family protein n=1 Tax=Streptomyces sp. SCSIO 30461 TaxID=3118085 RepID=UPI0030D10B3A
MNCGELAWQARPGRRGQGSRATWVRWNGAVTALVTCPIATAVRATVTAIAKGGLGTGSGLGGACFALLLPCESEAQQDQNGRERHNGQSRP